MVVRCRFGLDAPGEGKTFREPAGQLRLSEERVRQLLQRCLEKLREVAKRFDSICAPQ
ncbi:MAG: sigma factor-like helix-turn-helix DNA-binding protein [Planctomycetales bacterium]